MFTHQQHGILYAAFSHTDASDQGTEGEVATMTLRAQRDLPAPGTLYVRSAEASLPSGAIVQPAATLHAPDAATNTEAATPTVYRLEAAAPNPFSGSTTLRYALAEPGHVRLTVYDVLGREVAVLVEGPQATGAYEHVFEAGGDDRAL